MLYDLTSFLDSHDITYQFEGGLDSEPINDGIDINILNPIRFNGTIFKVDSELQLNCNIIYRFEANCDRCLKPIVTDFSTVLSGKLKGVDLNNQSCDCMGSTIDPRLEKLKELFPKK